MWFMLFVSGYMCFNLLSIYVCCTKIIIIAVYEHTANKQLRKDIRTSTNMWRDEIDFTKDIERISEFYISGEHNNTRNRFVFKSKQGKKVINTPWYESDSEEELDFSFGRGRNPSDSTRNPGAEPNHHDVMREIQMQVRSTVGNRYNNEVLESYYNVCKDDAPEFSPSAAPKEVSIGYAKELHRKRTSPSEPAKKTSIAQNIQHAAAKLTEQNPKSPVCPPVASSSSSAPVTPNKEKGSQKNNSKRRYGSRSSRNNSQRTSPDYSLPFATQKSEIDVYSNQDFPPL